MRREALSAGLIFVFVFLFFSTVKACSAGWEAVNIESKRINTLITTPYGIFAGEFDGRPVNPPPYNGVYKSIDIGGSFQKTGLAKKGITGLVFLNNRFYAGTYYFDSTPGGLYFSTDFGESWQQTGLNYSINNLAVTDNSILVGTASNGLFTFNSANNTYSQTIGNGFSSGIRTLFGFKNFALASSYENRTYISSDGGYTWHEITSLYGKVIKSFFINDKIMLAGSGNNDGYYTSINNGVTWTKNVNYGNKTFGSFSEFRNVIYTSIFSNDFNTYGVIKSEDGGLSWFDMSEGLQNPNNVSNSFSFVHGQGNFLFTSFTADGVFKHTLQSPKAEVEPFLDLPFTYTDFTKNINKISSFFDHEYPLLGYPYYTEPTGTKNTTVNYLGVKLPEPNLYYSSHNGIDFAVALGSPVLATASGYASYSYGSGSGNMIKIKHVNGFETWYMHLKKEGLIINSLDGKVWVEQGDIIGYVGMTGNTTGPHIHFSLIKNQNANNTYYDDFPDGLVDPFGWQNKSYNDPWNGYSWTDAIRTHIGSKSFYLWEKNLKTGESILNNKSSVINQEGVSVNLAENTTQKSGIFYLIFTPFMDFLNLKWLKGFGVVLGASDVAGNDLPTLDKEAEISIDYSNADLENINEESLKVFTLDDSLETLVPTDSTINTETKKISFLSSKLGKFAVYGEKKDITPPQTQITVTGNVLEFSANDGNGIGVSNIYYSLDNGENWEIYKEQIKLGADGEYKILYKSDDKYLNTEETKEKTITVGNSGFNKTVKIINARFKF